MSTREITEATLGSTRGSIKGSTLESTIEEHDLVLIQIWAPWCGPCHAYCDLFEELSNSHPSIVFATLNADEEKALIKDLDIHFIPTLMIFRASVAVLVEPGVMSRETLEDLIVQAKLLNMSEVLANV